MVGYSKGVRPWISLRSNPGMSGSIFWTICSIPHPSHHEEALAKALVVWAEQRSVNTYRQRPQCHHQEAGQSRKGTLRLASFCRPIWTWCHKPLARSAMTLPRILSSHASIRQIMPGSPPPAPHSERIRVSGAPGNSRTRAWRMAARVPLYDRRGRWMSGACVEPAVPHDTPQSG